MRISDWSSDVCSSDLVYAMQALEDAGVRLELLEQPFKAQDIDGLKYVTDRVHTPVMADESVFGPLQVIDLIKARAADIINIRSEERRVGKECVCTCRSRWSAVH